MEVSSSVLFYMVKKEVQFLERKVLSLGIGWDLLELSGCTSFPEFARGAPTAALRPDQVSWPRGQRGARRARPGRRAEGGEGAGTKAAATALGRAGARRTPAAVRVLRTPGTRLRARALRSPRHDEAPRDAAGARARRARRPAARAAPSAPSPPPGGGSVLGEHGGGGGRAGHFT